VAGERAINMALRVVGIGEVERDFKRVGTAGERSFTQVERAANGADRAVSEYTARLRRTVDVAKRAFDSTPGVAEARLQDPRGYLQARNQAILDAVKGEKERIGAGIPEATQSYDALGGTMLRVATIATGAFAAFEGLRRFAMASAEAFIEHEKALDNFEASLTLAGNRSTASASEIGAMAVAIRDASNQTEEGALKAAQALATIPNITKGALEEALSATAALADSLGGELPEVLEQNTLPVLRALAERDMKALVDAVRPLNDELAVSIMKLAAAGDTAGAQRALFDGLREAAGEPNGLTSATNRLNDSWEDLKLSFAEEFAGPAAAGLNLLAGLLERISDRANTANGSWRDLLATVVTGIPIIGPLLGLLGRAAPRPAGGQNADTGYAAEFLREQAGSMDAFAERRRLEKLYGTTPRRPRSGGGGRSDVQNEAERLKREADAAREAADRVIEANSDVIQTYRERVAEAESKIGLEGEALRALERQHEVDAAMRRINAEMIDKEVEARRAAAAAVGQEFDAIAATADATDMVEGQREAVRRLAEQLADANDQLAEFARHQAQAKAIIEEVRSPLDRLNDELDTTIDLHRRGFLTADQYEAKLRQLAEGMAQVAYETDESAKAWRGFGDDVARELVDIAMNGGNALDILQQLIRLPLERLLESQIQNPVANWIDKLTGNDMDARAEEIYAGLPHGINASVDVLAGSADGAAVSLTGVDSAARSAANALVSIATTMGNPVVELTGEVQKASAGMAAQPLRRHARPSHRPSRRREQRRRHRANPVDGPEPGRRRDRRAEWRCRRQGHRPAWRQEVRIGYARRASRQLVRGRRKRPRADAVLGREPARGGEQPAIAPDGLGTADRPPEPDDQHSTARRSAADQQHRQPGHAARSGRRLAQGSRQSGREVGMIDDVRLPEAWSKGSSGGPAFLTQVVPLASGEDDREERWDTELATYDIAHNIKSPTQIAELRAFHRLRRGASRGFLLKDWIEWTSASDDESPPAATDQPLGEGDGAETVFAIVKRYEDAVTSYDRPIAWPVADTVVVAVDGVVVNPADYTVQRGAGTITFDAAPADGAELTCGFTFDVPVRFVEDHLSISWDTINSRSAGQVPLQEVRNENGA
jgi:uncharacterized protein (TIGR02217 family)